MVDKWFLAVIFLISITSFSAIFTRVRGREKNKKAKDEKLSADDFEILDF